MGMSKKDLLKRKTSLKGKIEDLEKKARMDPVHRHPEVHEELARLKKEFEAL